LGERLIASTEFLENFGRILENFGRILENFWRVLVCVAKSSK
jgi:hypothetical protein